MSEAASLVGMVHTLPNKYASGIFMRGSEGRHQVGA